MNFSVAARPLCCVVFAALTLALLPAPGVATPTNIYFTQFEAAEGYDANRDLAGQNSWMKDGSGGNGLVSGFMPGQGQQAYIGFRATNSDQLLLWQPINFDPLAAGLPLVKFTVLMNIVDSENGNYDNFRWSVYNQQVQRLFSLDFDNYYTNVNYILNGTNQLVTTSLHYSPSSNYLLTVTMNFASNRWSASLGDALIATNLPITTTNVPLNLGEIDAVWLVYDTNAPGDNYLLFDNYRITAEALTVPAPPSAQVQMLGSFSGLVWLQVLGTDDTRWSLDATTNLVNWTALKTNTITGGYFDHVDTTAAPYARRFYRARWVP
jgi:hypothetical protein